VQIDNTIICIFMSSKMFIKFKNIYIFV